MRLKLLFSRKARVSARLKSIKDRQMVRETLKDRFLSSSERKQSLVWERDEIVLGKKTPNSITVVIFYISGLYKISTVTMEDDDLVMQNRNSKYIVYTANTAERDLNILLTKNHITKKELENIHRYNEMRNRLKYFINSAPWEVKLLIDNKFESYINWKIRSGKKVIGSINKNYEYSCTVNAKDLVEYIAYLVNSKIEDDIAYLLKLRKRGIDYLEDNYAEK